MRNLSWKTQCKIFVWDELQRKIDWNRFYWRKIVTSWWEFISCLNNDPFLRSPLAETFLIYYFWILIGKLLYNFSHCQWFDFVFCLTLKLDFCLVAGVDLMEIILCRPNYCIKFNLIYFGVYFAGFVLSTELLKSFHHKIIHSGIFINLYWDS